MKKLIFIVLFLLLLGVSALFLIPETPIQATPADQSKEDFAAEADKARLNHIAYWSGVIEEYHDVAGTYPFQDKATEKVIMVRIANKTQTSYFTPGSPTYSKELDLNYEGFYQEISDEEFIGELSRVLNRKIKPFYDIQLVPTKSPNWYHYMIAGEDYLLYTPCSSICGTWQDGGYQSDIATLESYFFFGEYVVPLVKVTSPGSQESEYKSFLYTELINNPTYQQLISSGYEKPGFVESRENNGDL